MKCLNENSECEGEVKLYTRDDLKSYPRCSFHQAKRQEIAEKSMEKYANSSVAPSWFDPGYAGESWDDDY